MRPSIHDPKHQIHVIYYQNCNGTYDAHVDGQRNICVAECRDLGMARTFIRILFEEQINECLIMSEKISYYEGL
jgi:hypothetical protein